MKYRAPTPLAELLLGQQNAQPRLDLARLLDTTTPQAYLPFGLAPRARGPRRQGRVGPAVVVNGPARAVPGQRCDARPPGRDVGRLSSQPRIFYYGGRKSGVTSRAFCNSRSPPITATGRLETASAANGTLFARYHRGLGCQPARVARRRVPGGERSKEETCSMRFKVVMAIAVIGAGLACVAVLYSANAPATNNMANNNMANTTTNQQQTQQVQTQQVQVVRLRDLLDRGHQPPEPRPRKDRGFGAQCRHRQDPVRHP